MANISIVNYCNLQCPYCFANDMIVENNYTISIDELKKIFDFVGKTVELVGIIGGEPTLHPKFYDVLTAFKEYKLTYNPRKHMTIFTNGIEMEQYLDTENFYDYFALLLNINHPDIMTNEQYNKTIRTLDKIKKDGAFENHVTIGCNFYPSRTDYQYIWDIINKYDIKELRVSTVAPGGQFKRYKEQKDEYYIEMKKIFFEQCKLAKKYGVDLLLDCNNVPFCYYTDEEMDLIKSLNIHNNCDFCEDPVVDVVFGHKISACFGAYDLIEPSLFDFNNMNDVKRYLRMHCIYPKIGKNYTGKCATCKQYELAQCQGGCLGFAN